MQGVHFENTSYLQISLPLERAALLFLLPPADSCLEADQQIPWGFSEQILHFSIFIPSSCCLAPLILFGRREHWAASTLFCPMCASIPPCKMCAPMEASQPLPWHHLIHVGEGRSWVIGHSSACPGKDLTTPSESGSMQLEREELQA